MSEIIERIPVYFAGRKPGRGRADDFITREQACDLRALGMGDWHNDKQKCFVLNRREHELPRTQPSCSMGPSIIFRFALGEPDAIGLVEGWTPRLKAA